MSRLSLAPPNFCSCTVNRARNLPNKGKDGGIDAFCTISMGKDKFVTAVVDKTTAPDWHEQCDMAIVDDATVKLTVYHKSHHTLSKGDFIGRAYVSLRDLTDYDRVNTKWYKLTNKDGKIDKDRGEIEVSLQFYSRNNTTGSVLDLASKKKHFSLKEMKHSLGAKLKSAAKHKHDGENQLSDQRRRLGGDNGSSYNVHDDSPSETTSYTGSHLSLNSMSYNNNNELGRKPDNKLSTGANLTPASNRSGSSALPDIVVEQTGKKLPPRGKKPTLNGLSVLGYENVKSVPVQPKIREELEYLDRDDLLHVIAYQTDLIKKRDTRVKDLEQYTDGLLCKIVEQCPTILQSAGLEFNNRRT